MDSPPLVAHVIHRLAIGGLENGLVNLINHSPADRYRHAIIALTTATDFRDRICCANVPVVELHKAEGHDFGVHRRFWRTLRQLQPDIVHTRNLPALEFQFTAALAGVPGRIHGEHGRDMYDLDGRNFKYNLLRKSLRPFVQRYTAVSKDLAVWLTDTLGIAASDVKQIYNGVDTEKFKPRSEGAARLAPDGFLAGDPIVVGTVGRMEPVKDQLNLVRAFIKLINSGGEAKKRLRLLMVGDGALHAPALQLLRQSGMDKLAWLPGERSDVAALLQTMDLFVLPSLREGISNTILEAMATGLPVIATHVGGNPELVDEGGTGTLVPDSDDDALATAIAGYLAEADKVLRHGRAARRVVEERFSLASMVAGYLQAYDGVLSAHRRSGVLKPCPTAGHSTH